MIQKQVLKKKTNGNINATCILILSAVFLLPATTSAQKLLKHTGHEPLGGMRTKFINDVGTVLEKVSAIIKDIMK